MIKTARRIALITALLASDSLFGQQTISPAGPAIDQALDRYVHLHVAVTRSASEANEAAAIVDQLNRMEHQMAAKAVLNRITGSTDGKDIGKYMWLLGKITPSAKEDLISAISDATNSTAKSKLVGALKEFKGTDVIRTLVTQLDDTSPGEINGTKGPQTLRICDYAFDDLYVRLRHISDLHLNTGTDIGDMIVRGVPVEVRDERIKKLKTALFAKYGPDLKVDEERE